MARKYDLDFDFIKQSVNAGLTSNFRLLQTNSRKELA